MSDGNLDAVGIWDATEISLDGATGVNWDPSMGDPWADTNQYGDFFIGTCNSRFTSVPEIEVVVRWDYFESYLADLHGRTREDGWWSINNGDEYYYKVKYVGVEDLDISFPDDEDGTYSFPCSMNNFQPFSTFSL